MHSTHCLVVQARLQKRLRDLQLVTTAVVGITLWLGAGGPMSRFLLVLVVAGLELVLAHAAGARLERQIDRCRRLARRIEHFSPR